MGTETSQLKVQYLFFHISDSINLTSGRYYYSYNLLPCSTHHNSTCHVRTIKRFWKVNGCELPGEIILSVQPSDPFHNYSKSSFLSSNNGKKIQSPLPLPTVEAATKNNIPIGNNEVEQTGEDDEGDLDDFFASLEWTVSFRAYAFLKG